MLTSVYSKNIGIFYNSKIAVHKEIHDKFKTFAVLEHIVVSMPYYKFDPPSMMQSIKQYNCDFILAIGDDAAKAALISNIPGIFTLVMDPIGNGLMDSNLKPLGSLTGILMDVEPKKQVSILQNLFIDKTHGGILYNPATSEYLIDSHTKEWGKHSYRIVGIPVKPEEEVPPLIEGMKRHVNYALSIVDPAIYNSNNIQIMIRFSLTHKIPFVGFTQQHAKMGALIAFYNDYSSIGEQAYNILTRILKANDNVIPQIEWAEKFLYSINSQTAEILKISILETYKENAEKIF